MREAVEILLATMNGERYLSEQVDSILGQTDDRWHLTISDDGSTDGTPSLIDEYVRRYPDRISRLCSGTQFGCAREHFLYLMRQCEADYMLFCDQDDVWYPDKLQKIREALDKATAESAPDTPILVFSDQTPTDAALKPLAPSLMRYQKQYFERFDYRSILMQNVVTGGAMGINRALARLGGRCPDTSKIIMHDWWLAAVAARFGRIVYIDEPLGAYRQHAESTVGAKQVGSIRYCVNRLTLLSDVKRTIREKKEQALLFKRTYSPLLDEADAGFIDAFGKPRSGLLFYLKHSGLIHGIERKVGLAVLG